MDQIIIHINLNFGSEFKIYNKSHDILNFLDIKVKFKLEIVNTNYKMHL